MLRFLKTTEPPDVERPGAAQAKAAAPKPKGRPKGRPKKEEPPDDQRIDLSAAPKGKPRGPAANIRKLENEVERLSRIIDPSLPAPIEPAPIETPAEARLRLAIAAGPTVKAKVRRHSSAPEANEKRARAQSLRMADPETRLRSASAGRAAMEDPELRRLAQLGGALLGGSVGSWNASECAEGGALGAVSGPLGGPSGALGGPSGALGGPSGALGAASGRSGGWLGIEGGYKGKKKWETWTPEEKQALRKRCAEGGRAHGWKGGKYGKLGGRPRVERSAEDEAARQSEASRLARSGFGPDRKDHKWSSKYQLLKLIFKERMEKGIDKEAPMLEEELTALRTRHLKKGKNRDLLRVWEMREKILSKENNPQRPGLRGGRLQKGQHGATAKIRSQRTTKSVGNEKAKVGRPSQLEPVHKKVKHWFEDRRAGGVEVRRYDILIEFLHQCQVGLEMWL